MAKQHELRDGDIVTRPDWNDGKPVRITIVGDALRWQDVNAHGRAHQIAYGYFNETEVTIHARRGGR